MKKKLLGRAILISGLIMISPFTICLFGQSQSNNPQPGVNSSSTEKNNTVLMNDTTHMKNDASYDKSKSMKSDKTKTVTDTAKMGKSTTGKSSTDMNSDKTKSKSDTSKMNKNTW